MDFFIQLNTIFQIKDGNQHIGLFMIPSKIILAIYQSSHVEVFGVIAIVICLPSFLIQKFRQENPANRNRIQL